MNATPTPEASAIIGRLVGAMISPTDAETALSFLEEIAKLERERDEANARYERLRGAVNGSSPRDLERLEQLEKFLPVGEKAIYERDDLRTVLRAKEANAERLQKLDDQLHKELDEAKRELAENLSIVCATQEGRTQWNAKAIWKINRELMKELEPLRKACDELVAHVEKQVVILDEEIDTGGSERNWRIAAYLKSALITYNNLPHVQAKGKTK